MIQFLRSIRLETTSFWIGFLAASLFWWLFLRLRPGLAKLWRRLKENWGTARQGLTSNAERQLRNNILFFAQEQHLAALLFSLDEIGLEPQLLIPSPPVVPDQEPVLEDIVNRLLPYTPDWPELVGEFNGQTVSISEAVQGGAHLALIGQPGSGRSFSLAYLAAHLARRDEQLGEVKQHLPILLHASELICAQENGNPPLACLEHALANRASVLAKTRLSTLLTHACQNGQAMLLIDGLDELPPDPMRQVVAFISELLAIYPDIQIVVAATHENLAGLPQLGFIPMAMANWSRLRQAMYIQNWSRLWAQHFRLPGDPTIDPVLLNGWLLYQNAGLTTLEFTLKVWAAYAGDARGSSGRQAIEAYVRRMNANAPDHRSSIEHLAAQAVLRMQPTFSQNEASGWLSEVHKNIKLDSDSQYLEGDQNFQPAEGSSARGLPDLARHSLLVKRADGQYGFVHPIIVGYLAAPSLAYNAAEETLFTQPDWSLKTISTHYMATHLDLSRQAQELLAESESPTRPGLLAVARWLRDIPEEANWRKPILQQLVTILQQEALHLGLRVRVLSALATAADPGIASLFRHLCKSPQQTVRMLAALGSGFIRDMQAIPELVKLLNDYLPVSQAACLALINIGTKPAIEAVASALLHGEEDLRRAAAEAFAAHPEEGHAILKEAIIMDDILVRRSAVAGLWRVRADWSYRILQELQIEDGQWVVRTAAAQAFEDLNRLNPHVPRRLTSLEEVPWLVAFANALDLGIAPGKPALEMLNKALREGKPVEQLAALDQIRWRSEVEVFPELYHLLFGSDSELREAAYNTLWHLDISSTELPPPRQFGLGL